MLFLKQEPIEHWFTLNPKFKVKCLDNLDSGWAALLAVRRGCWSSESGRHWIIVITSRKEPAEPLVINFNRHFTRIIQMLQYFYYNREARELWGDIISGFWEHFRCCLEALKTLWKRGEQLAAQKTDCRTCSPFPPTADFPQAEVT